MMKKIDNTLRLLLVIVLGFSVFVRPASAASDPETLGDLKKIYEQALAEKAANDNKTEEAKKEIKEKEAAITAARSDLSEAEEEEEEAQLKIVESNEKIEENKLESEKVLLYMQQVKSQNAYVEYVTGASSMTELVTRIEAIKQVSDYIQVTLKDLELEIEKNEKLKVELEEKQKELSGKITSYQATVEKLYSNIDAYDEFAPAIDERVNSAKMQYEAEKQVCIEKLGAENVNDNTRRSLCSSVPINVNWMNPLTSGVVTSPMGYRTHPVTGKVYSFHNALDIGVAEGTPVYAAASGRVAARIERSSCGGNMLFIDVTVNGKNYTTYYYHLLRFNVNVGDIVTQNTIIGYSGGGSTAKSRGGYDACTTGAHLHYGVQNGWYNARTGVVSSNVIVPPGFKNQVGYRFTSRTSMYWG